MKIVLVIPPSPFLIDDRAFPFLGPLQIAAVAREHGHEVRVADLTGYKARHPETLHADPEAVHAAAEAELCSLLDEMRPDLVGFYSLAAQHPTVVRLHQMVRTMHPETWTALGGPHASTAPERAAKDGFDFVVVADQGGGGGEPGFLELLASIERRWPLHRPPTAGRKEPAILREKSRTPDGGAYQNDRWPLPARDLIDLGSYRYTIAGERSTSIVSCTGCPFACTYSLTGDALIHTDRGFERLDTMMVGESVVEACGHGSFVRTHRIGRSVATAEGTSIAAEAVSEGIRPVFEVMTENGLKVKATAEHPFLTVVGDEPVWKKVRDLKVGDWLVLKTPERVWPTEYVPLPKADLSHLGKRPKKLQVPEKLTEDLAWLAGYIIGDGSIPLDGRPAIHVCVKDRSRDRLLRIVPELFGAPLVVYEAINTDKMQQGWIYSRAARSLFTETLGIDPANKLHVPALILQSPRSVVAAFWEGLMAADGYFPEGHPPYLTTVSWDLAREIANVLIMLGEVPTIVHVKPSNYEGAWSKGECYRISALANDRIPTERALYKSSKSGKWHWRTARSRKSFLGIRRRTLVESGLSHPLDRPGWHYVRVEAVTRGISEPVYDLRVPGPQNFVADGLVAHNCSHWEGYRKLEMKSPERVREEIRWVKDNLGWRGIMFYDDEINLRPDFMGEFLPMLRDEGVVWRAFFKCGKNFMKDEVFEAMAASGCAEMCTGAESADPGILKAIKKGATLEDNTAFVRLCVKHGIAPKVFTQVGLPGETPETIEALKSWLVAMAGEGLANADVSITTPYEGTPIYDEPEKHAITYDKASLDYSKRVILYKGTPGEYFSHVSHPRLTADQIVVARQWVEDEFRKAAGLGRLGAAGKDDG